MKFSLKTLFFLLLFVLPARAQVAVTGNLKDITGTSVVSNSEVDFELQNYKGIIPRIAATGVIAQVKKVFKPDNTGAIHCVGSGCTDTLYRNIDVTPTGTFYSVCIIFQGQTLRCNNYLINGSFNLNTATPLNGTENVGPGSIFTQCFRFVQLAANVTWTITHNFQDNNVFVETSDANGIVTFPDHADISDPNVTVLTWIAPQAGHALVCHAAQINIATNQPDAIVSHPTGLQTIYIQPLTLTGDLNVTQLTTGKCVEIAAGGHLVSAANACGVGVGGVTSVGLGLPKEFNVSGSPVTTSGTLTGAWVQPPSRTFLAGNGANTISGVFDVEGSGISGTVNSTATVTPTTSHTMAFFTTYSSINRGSGAGQSGAPTPPAGWSSLGTIGNNGQYLTKTFSSGGAITATEVYTDAIANMALMVALKYPSGSPTVRQQTHPSGASAFTAVMPGNTLAGSSLLFIHCGQSTSGNGQGTAVDNQGDEYTLVGYVPNGLSSCIAFLSSNIVGGTTPTLTFYPPETSWCCSDALFMELTGLSTQNSDPGFRNIQIADLPIPLNSVPPTFAHNTFWAGPSNGAASPDIPTVRLIAYADEPGTTPGGNCTGTNFMQGVSAGSVAICTAAPSTVGVQTFAENLLSGDVSVSAATLTTVGSQAITMPSAGCPCRVYMAFGMGWTYTLSGAVDFYVTDGTNDFIHTPTKSTSAGVLVGGINGSGYTNVTYSNGATVTFTLKVKAENAITIRAAANQAGPNSFLQVVAQTSN